MTRSEVGAIDAAAGTARAEQAALSLEQLGYRQELKRSLSLSDLVVYGLVFISPTVPFATFGIVFNASHGMVPLVYAFGVVAMGLTALSYATMSRAFPIAGSVYVYAGKGIGEIAGFLAGWAMLLDYVLLPTVVYVLIAVAIQAVVPEVPRAASIILGIGFTSTFNLLGIESTARLNRLLLALNLSFLALFMVLAGRALANGLGGAYLSTAPLFQASEVSPGLLFGALSIALYSFLGFDGISTLAEEARGGTSAVGRATLWSLILVGVLFVAQTYLASLFVLGKSSFPPGQPTDGAIYEIAEIIGGAWFVILASSKVLFAGTGAALASQTATARLLFSMARDGTLPRWLAHVNSRHQVPDRAIVLVAGINVVVGLAFANHLELLASMVNFGALTGFMLLHLSVIVHFMWRLHSNHWPQHLLVPILGFAIVAYVVFNMGVLAKLAGLAWLVLGIAVLSGRALIVRRRRLPA